MLAPLVVPFTDNLTACLLMWRLSATHHNEMWHLSVTHFHNCLRQQFYAMLWRLSATHHNEIVAPQRDTFPHLFFITYISHDVAPQRDTSKIEIVAPQRDTFLHLLQHTDI